MEIRLLGPVELRSREHAVVLDSNKERLVLAQLALEANRPVAVDTLLAHGWEGVDPAGAASRIHRPLSLLRRHLTQAAGPGGPRLIRGSGVYTLNIAPDVVDLHRYRSLLRRGRELARAGDDAAAHRVLVEAVPLWRGDPLLGLTGSWPEGVRRSLEPLRRGVDTARMGAVLRLHKYTEAVDELCDLVERHPDDETYVVQLMLALTGIGRLPDATAVYQDARRRLASEFGLGPGPVLRRVHQGLLAGEPADRLVAVTQGGMGTVLGTDADLRARAGAGSLAGTERPTAHSAHLAARPLSDQGSPSVNSPTAQGTPAGTRYAVPTGMGISAKTTALTPTVSHQSPGSSVARRPFDSLPRQGPLIGRSSELGALITRATAAAKGQGPDPVTLICISGMPGVGKSALSIGAARALADHFPDGVVFLRLNAHAEGGPIGEGAALSRLLALTGFPENDVPRDIAARGALWRARLAELHCLLVLDDAGDPHHVGPLLPGDSSPSFTIITSRRQLTGLPAAYHLTLDVLPVEDAVALFRLFAGSERTRNQAAVAEIVSLTGCIALGVELLASRFATRPAWSLGDLIERLTRLPGRLGEIHDMHNELARAFEFSYLALTDEQRCAFRRLGLHPGHDFTVQDAQALLGSTPTETERLLEALLVCHLIGEPQPDRYLAHSLLHEYAALLAYEEESADERRAAITRLITYYVDAADRAVRILLPNRIRTGRSVTDGTVRPPRWHSAREAHAWLALERRNLTAAESVARTLGQSEIAARLGQLVAVYLDSESQWSEAELLHLRGIAHWTRVGDREALRHALIMLAENGLASSKYAAALEACERALDMARADDDTDTEAAAFGVAGVVRLRMGDVQLSIDHQKRALTMRSQVGSAFDRARCHNNLAMALLDHAEFAAAEAHFEKGLHWFHAAGDTRAETIALNNVANLHSRRGSLATARRFFETALARAEADGNLYQLATTRSNLAEILSRCGEFDRALALHHDAIRDFSEVHNRFGLANAINNLAQTRSRAGQYDEAVRQHREALRIAEEINAGSEIAEALRGLGRAELERGDAASAERHLRAALTQSSDAPRGIALSRATLADILVARGHVAEAIRQLTDAICLMRDVDPYEAERMEERLAELRDSAQGGVGE